MAIGLGLVVLLLVLALPARATTVQRVVSPGGIEAWLVEEHAIPLISMQLLFRGGSALDPDGKEGLAVMASYLIDEGAGEYDSDAFQRRLADRSIRLSAEATLDNFRVKLDTLTIHRDEAFALLGLALARPRFDPPAVERMRQQALVNVVQNDENPEFVAAATWYENAFPDHPYGRRAEGTPESLAAIAPEDLHGFARARFARDNLLIGVVGDITAEELASLLDSTFGTLPAKAASWEVPEARVSGAGRVIVVPMDIPQSVVMFGTTGLKRDDPDFYAAYVMNQILGGGGFTSRLTEEVREKRGLAYSVYTYLDPLRHVGLYLGSVATRNERVAESIDLIRAEMARLEQQGVSPQELADVKTQMTGAFPLRFDSNKHIARTLLSMQLDDLGIDYIDRRNDYIEAVGLDDIGRVAKRLLSPDALLVVVVGRPVGVESTP